MRRPPQILNVSADCQRTRVSCESFATGDRLRFVPSDSGMSRVYPEVATV